MGTRSRIGYLNEDGSIISAYHHYDGYPAWLGVTLKKHFHTERKALKLIKGGDMSTCWTKQRWSKKLGSYENRFYGPQYYSKRGDDRPAQTSKNFKEFQKLVAWEEYMYIFVQDTWVAYKVHTKTGYSGFANYAPCTFLEMVTIPKDYPEEYKESLKLMEKLKTKAS